ncbi:putative amidohydrolase [Planctomycetota bacterium]|nr:putative amidohydrolase [Planctomycetota bacterium]
MFVRTWLAIPLVASLTAQAPDAKWLSGELDNLTLLYQQLHKTPELSFHETKTAARVALELETAGLQVTRNVGGLGVVAMLENGDGPVGLLRCDMDALPIAEQTSLPYASTIRAEAADGTPIGVMHACGHDIHMATMIGTARWFMTHKSEWQGTLLFIAQPAEERSGGMRAMVKDGLLTRFPKPAFALALHCDPALPTGTIGVRSGPLMAAVDSADITFFGKGGHGAMPHLTIDPIVLAAQFVVDIQTIVSREVDPIEPCLITVGSFHGGTKHNIIPDHVDLQLTLRSYSPVVREQLKAAIIRKAEALAQSTRAPKPTVEFAEPTGALKNDDQLVQRTTIALRNALSAPCVVTAQQQMIAEDFGQLSLAGIPICMFRLGTIAPARLKQLEHDDQVPLLHTATYYPDAKESISTGVTAMVTATRALLTK